jgi:ABC-type phosphate transport system permease subunit
MSPHAWLMVFAALIFLLIGLVTGTWLAAYHEEMSRREREVWRKFLEEDER